MDQAMKAPMNKGQAAGQGLANGMLEDNYPRDMWWVAARGDEVGEKPLARWLLEKPVVLYRLKDGTGCVGRPLPTPLGAVVRRAGR